MKENQILAIIKKPGERATVEPLFDNTLEASQKAVGGFIEVVRLCQDVAIICNEEGRLMDLTHNVNVCGYDFVGTIVAVGVKGDQFCSLKASAVPMLLKLLDGEG